VTVRVIKVGGGPAPREKFQGNVRRIDAARWDARVESERTIAEAHEQARAIVAEAQAKADAIRAQAEAEGKAKAQAESAAIMIAARAEAMRLAERATEVVIAATKAVAERALGRALESDAQLNAWAEQAIATLAGARKIAVHAAKATLARLDLPVNKVESELPEGVLLIRSELGDVRLELPAQVDALVNAISEVLGAEVRRRA
jgi:vacuolar-type H+-ATPase subunit E/Vma4